MRQYAYDEVLEACAAGEYASCEIRAASGRLNRLLGVPPEAYARLAGLARFHRTGLLLLGSRVSGPRSRQRLLHPALANLPLETDARSPSAVDPGASGVRIEKTAIKEYGRSDPRTSDLTVLVVDRVRADAELRALAVVLETELNGLGLSFPVRVFTRIDRGRWRCEDDFLDEAAAYLGTLDPSIGEAARREAAGELYATVNLPRAILNRTDCRNAALTAVLFTASFSLGLGFHWVLPAAGFVFGLFGRYLARLRAGTARALGDAWLGNGAALLLDASIGAALMGGVIVPLAGLPIGWRAILAGSASHTLAKGTMRLWLDKRFSAGPLARQSAGVLAVSALNFAQGVLTSLVYAGSKTAWAMQIAVCLAGAVLLFGPVLISRRDSRPPSTP